MCACRDRSQSHPSVTRPDRPTRPSPAPPESRYHPSPRAPECRAARPGGRSNPRHRRRSQLGRYVRRRLPPMHSHVLEEAMIDLTPQALAVLRAQHGVAHRCRCSQRRRCQPQSPASAGCRGAAAGRSHRRVYRLARSPLTFESRCVALCLAHPSGLHHRTDRRAADRRCDECRRSEPIHFCVPHGSNIGPIDGVIAPAVDDASSPVGRRSD